MSAQAHGCSVCVSKMHSDEVKPKSVHQQFRVKCFTTELSNFSVTGRGILHQPYAARERPPPLTSHSVTLGDATEGHMYFTVCELDSPSLQGSCKHPKTKINTFKKFRGKVKLKKKVRMLMHANT